MALDNVFNGNGEKVSNLLFDTLTGEYKRVEYIEKNCIINYFEGGKCELVYYDKPFSVPKHIAMDSDMMNTEDTFFNFSSLLGQRKFKRIGDVAVPLKVGVTMADMERTIIRGGRRAIDNFYNYALSNDWEYFCTYTFAEKHVRLDLELLSQTWSNFIRCIKYRYPNVKVIAVPEAFDNEESGFHLHSLMANCDLDLLPKRYNPGDKSMKYRSELELDIDMNDPLALIKQIQGQKKESPYKIGQFMYTPYGAARMTCTNWKKGFNEVVMINPESSQLQVVNYLTKYLTKGFNLPFGQKRFYRTNNLDTRFKQIEFHTREDILDKVANLGLKQYVRTKGNHDMMIFRNF